MRHQSDQAWARAALRALLQRIADSVAREGLDALALASRLKQWR